MLQHEVRRSAVKDLLNTITEGLPPHDVGFGIATQHRVVGHGGGFPGISSQLDIYLDRGYDVAVMSNYDPPAASHIAGKLRSLICRM